MKNKKKPGRGLQAAAEIHTLDILEESIQDLKWNYTSFIAAVR